MADTPPERRLEETVEAFINHLESIEEAYNVREHNGTVDFTVGDPDLWPRYSAEDEIRAIRSSAVDFDSLHPDEKGVASQSDPQMGQNIHLPPAEEDLYDGLDAEADFPGEFLLVDGTFKLGSLLPPPDGICTPHLMLVEDAELDAVIDAVDEVFRLYDEVYDGGDRIIKHKPS